MSEALDLALSVTDGATVTPGLVHDPDLPLVIGDPDSGEFLAVIYNPITRNLELKVASDALDVISTLTLHPTGTLLLNGQPLFDVVSGDLQDAVTDAQAAATAAAGSATSAAASASAAQTARAGAENASSGFQTIVNNATTDLNVKIAEANDILTYVQELAVAAQAAASTSTTQAGAASASATDAALRASADNDYVFPDGTKSSKAYAAEARAIAQLSRAAPTRILEAANFPEACAPGNLFTRARIMATTAVQVTIPPDVWRDVSGEAWMTYRLEGSGGSVEFVPQAGSVSTSAPALNSVNPVTMRRLPVGATTSTQHDGLAVVPTGYTGKICLQIAISHNTASAVTASVSLGGGLTPVVRRAHVTPSDADFTVNYVVVEAQITSWAGGDLAYSVVAGPNVNNIFVKPWLVASALVPTVVVNRNAGSGSTVQATLAALPSQSLVLAMAIQRGVSTVFSAWSSNVTNLASGNTAGVGPADAGADNNASRSHAWAVASGVAAALADFVVSASFSSTTNRATICLIHYAPNTVTPVPAVNAIFQGGRDTLDIVGAEAELWFNPDGRTVVISIPAA